MKVVREKRGAITATSWLLNTHKAIGYGTPFTFYCCFGRMEQTKVKDVLVHSFGFLCHPIMESNKAYWAFPSKNNVSLHHITTLL